MKFALPIAAAAAVLVAAMPVAAQFDTERAGTPPVFVTGIVASYPDPNDKVPKFNAVPGAGIETWSDGLAQAVLTGGQYYEYCVSAASATASGTGAIAYKITRGKKVIQSATIITNITVANDDVWYYCAGYHQLPVSPGAANLVGTFTYTPTGGKPETTSLSTHVLLK